MTGLLPSTVEPWVAIPAGAEVELSWRQGIFGHIKMVLVWEGRWRPIPLEQPSVLTCRVLKKKGIYGEWNCDRQQPGLQSPGSNEYELT